IGDLLPSFPRKRESIRHSRESGNPSVIPAKAGIHRDVFGPTPPLDARFRGHDDVSFADKIFTELPTRDTSSLSDLASRSDPSGSGHVRRRPPECGPAERTPAAGPRIPDPKP